MFEDGQVVMSEGVQGLINSVNSQMAADPNLSFTDALVNALNEDVNLFADESVAQL
jgi:hypothetical protein